MDSTSRSSSYPQITNSSQREPLIFDNDCILPLLDGSDFILTSAFGHGLRASKPLERISNQLQSLSLNLPILDLASKTNFCPSLSNIEDYVQNPIALHNFINSTETSQNEHSDDLVHVKITQLRLLCWHPSLDADEGMRLICHETNNLRLQMIASLSQTIPMH